MMPLSVPLEPTALTLVSVLELTVALVPGEPVSITECVPVPPIVTLFTKLALMFNCAGVPELIIQAIAPVTVLALMFWIILLIMLTIPALPPEVLMILLIFRELDAAEKVSALIVLLPMFTLLVTAPEL